MRRFFRAAGIGLGTGAGIGLLETLFVLGSTGFPDDAGRFGLFSVAAWAAIGAAVAVVAGIRIGGPSAGRPETGSAAMVLRTAAALTASLLVARVDASFLAGASIGRRLAVHLPLLLVAALVWWLAPRLGASSGPCRLAARVARNWPVVALLAFAVAVVLWQARAQRVELRRFEPVASAATPPPVADFAPKVMVLGIDAATWDIALPLVESGRMPVLRSWMERGTWGVLRSYDVSRSPTVWTSIMTGKDASHHGIDLFTDASAANRRVKSVWQIAGELDTRTAVINVPATYPVLGAADVMLSGFPVPGATLGHLGWFATTGEPARARGSLTLKLDLDPSALAKGATIETTLALRHLPATSRSRLSSLLYLLERASQPLSRRLRWYATAVPFGRLRLELSGDPGQARMRGRDAGSGAELFDLHRGEWSDWLVALVHGRPHGFKVRFVDTEADEIALFVTPFYPFPEPKRARPAVTLAGMLESPYVAEGLGWGVFTEPRLIETFRSHLMDVAVSRAALGQAVLERLRPGLFIYVFTVTDRIQHGLMKFMAPEAYLRLAETEGGEYATYAPTEEQARRFDDAIPQAYRLVDSLMGRMLERAGPGTDVVIVSDHGAQPGLHRRRPTGGAHHPDGIYVVVPARERRAPQPGPDGEGLAARRGPQLAIEDVTPILLRLLGAPLAEDMQGALPAFVERLTGPPAFVASYDSDGEGRLLSDPETLDPDVLEQLRSLGYLD